MPGSLFQYIYRSTNPLLRSTKEYFRFAPSSFIKHYRWFFRQYRELQKLGDNQAFKEVEWYPCFNDNLDHTPVEPVYFLQDTWAARKLCELNPSHHYDIGSSVKTMGILSQFIPVTMVDIRPIEIELEHLNFVCGSILDLPFEDSSIESLSSLCVIEHIGLGRYGDSLDPFGYKKAIDELKRVLKPGGTIMFSVPVDRENKIYFNAHRAFTRDYILGQFNGFTIEEEKYQYGRKLYDKYDPAKGFGTVLLLLRK